MLKNAHSSMGGDLHNIHHLSLFAAMFSREFSEFHHRPVALTKNTKNTIKSKRIQLFTNIGHSRFHNIELASNPKSCSGVA